MDFVGEFPELKPVQLKKIIADPIKTAEAAQLVYVTDKEPGIERRKKGKSFYYVYNNRKLNRKEELERIKKLVIPPAWQQVWICSLPNGHLQVTGLDAANRKQYKYHTLWTQLRNHTKYFRLYDFGLALPSIRKRLESDLGKKGLPKEKVLALVVSLMQLTNIRIGNSEYEKLYGSFGLTTLKDRHVKTTGDKTIFSFKGKKGVKHNISITSKRFSKLVKCCRDIPGQELFQYIDENGNYAAISSGDVNSYIREISGADFTAKDFRTWAGTIHTICALKDLEQVETKTAVAKNIVAVLDNVSSLLGNTRSVCKKYYVHPLVLKLYEENTLHSYLAPAQRPAKGLSGEERALMNLLKKHMHKPIA